jgi:hypothetical protein
VKDDILNHGGNSRDGDVEKKSDFESIKLIINGVDGNATNRRIRTNS